MGQPFIGEIRMFGGNFAPAGWMFCDGSLIPISENDTLFNLIGTTYGGDGQETFALPDLRGRVPIHSGQGPGLSNYTLSENAGVETVTLSNNQIPVHSHALLASIDIGDSPTAQDNVVSQSTSVDLYTEDVVDANMSANIVSPVGGSQPHENMQPFLTVSFIISMFGIFPQQN
ncbi:MAG TPA: tail fiber protein [Pyrinomonadaceae bacterium]|nr:tail fiber protein [Pyrinomonadaceae bacterium]